MIGCSRTFLKKFFQVAAAFRRKLHAMRSFFSAQFRQVLVNDIYTDRLYFAEKPQLPHLLGGTLEIQVVAGNLREKMLDLLVQQINLIIALAHGQG